MPRLFRKFLITIWLTLALSIAGMTLVLMEFQASPLVPKLELQKREILLDLAQQTLIEHGEDEVRQLIRTSNRLDPLGLAIDRIGGDCADAPTEAARTVRDGAACFRITLQPYDRLLPDKVAPIMLVLAGLLASLLAAVLLARYLIRPVKDLRDGLSALAQGRFDVRIGRKMTRRNDEITALGQDFDVTAERLQEHRETQQRLFHHVSHELRSPLSRLQAAVGILRKSPARLEPMLERMDREVERLDALVGEILTLARLTVRSGVPLQTQMLDVIDLLNDILADAAFEGQDRGISITTDIGGTFPAEVEGELIYRALENVIRNAVRHSAPGTQVRVSCNAATDRLAIEVTDSGPGVVPEDLDRIFQPFSRGKDAQHHDGYGLGLAIARQAVERHGGDVRAALPGGGGLVITMEIPRYPPRPADAIAAGPNRDD
ncbi:HAMP domain-containing sensor histidine kinase [Mangrovicoccus algicola]|uniref:histidine kinase n=1 Tax=Mangrovicoccus algicola TaxID=2771008 RepID=A0A8J6Z488_9RHOB|nr:HAMP domain-containing sensor histidine kinase [Mangrovicoccus algicola]MBE3637239.1 HAMP domain-containing histidine kinase [Mangrovicoccus algicola]